MRLIHFRSTRSSVCEIATDVVLRVLKWTRRILLPPPPPPPLHSLTLCSPEDCRRPPFPRLPLLISGISSYSLATTKGICEYERRCPSCSDCMRRRMWTRRPSSNTRLSFQWSHPKHGGNGEWKGRTRLPQPTAFRRRRSECSEWRQNWSVISSCCRVRWGA